jgi:phenylalanyl-tRNA synthetase beta chain
VVGYVEKLEKHPEADKLNVAQVNVGQDELVQIVCGAPNLVAERYVAVALPGAKIHNGMEIGKTKLRGVKSEGMICGADEIGFDAGPDLRHIWLLDEKKKWDAGVSLVKALKLDDAHSPEELSDLITKHTAEVEEVIPSDRHLHNVVSGKLIAFEDIEGSEKLSKATVDVGYKEIQLIFGKVHEVKVGEILPIALAGAKLPGGVITVKEMMGVRTEGMIAADDEMGLENTIEGLTRFPADTPIGKEVADLLDLRGFEVDIDNKSLTHRPDLWGHYGFARELSAILGKPLSLLDELIYDGKFGDETEVKVTIERDDICPHFTACAISGITIEESPQWMKARLQKAGMNPINNIVDITNYVMLELGQPMHAYDREQVGSDEFVVAGGKKDVKLVTLDQSEHELHEEDPVIYNADGEPLILAGIKGGMKSGIHNETTEILLEAANWDPVLIRKASVRHQLRTDASQRFEKSLDPGLCETALRRAIKLILEICPTAKLISPISINGAWTAPNIKINVRPDSVRSKVGINIPTDEMVHILTALDFGVEGDDKGLKVRVPLHRATSDVDIEEDIVEEIARIHGYDRIPAELPELPAALPVPNDERRYKHKTRALLANHLGFTEVLTYSFYGADLMAHCGLKEEDHIHVLNYLSEDQTHMRTTLTPNILAVVEKNQKEFSEINIFEIGRTYKEIGEYMPQEEKGLIFAIAMKTDPFFEAKGALEDYLEAFGLSGAKFQASKNPAPFAHPKKCVDVMVKGQMVGNVFTVHPGVLNSYEIDLNVAVVELKFSKLVERGLDKLGFSEPPKFPGMSFDLSILVDEKAEAGKLSNSINKVDKLIESVDLFDIYQGKGIPEGKKSLSYKIDLRHTERTLTDTEFKTIQAAVIEVLAKAGAELRA